MKIKVENNFVYFYPENDFDIFNLGKLTNKLDKSKSIFNNIDKDSEKMDYLEVEVKDFLRYLFN